MIKKDTEYDFIEPLPQQLSQGYKRGQQCGECGMKFEYGVSYGFYCGNPRCPSGWGANRGVGTAG